MSSEKNAIDLQRQVRQNAREYQSSVKDLYSWEKEIKSKEEALKKAPAPEVRSNVAPVRSHVTTVKQPTVSSKPVEECVTGSGGSAGSSAASTPTEKQDVPQDASAQLHKKANDVKDRGNSYVKQADYEKAIVTYTEAIEIYPCDPIYFINRALCHLKLERYVECVDDCDVAIVLDKLCVKAYYRRMQANESLGNNMEALKDCTTVLTLDPKNTEAKSSLARINERLRKNASKQGPVFNAARDDVIDILPFDKPAYKRSKKPMRRVAVVDIVSPRPNPVQESQSLRISDDDIDKIFNSNCGPFEEVKKNNLPKAAAISKPIVQETKTNKQEATKLATVVESKVITNTSLKSTEQIAKATPKENLKSEDSDNIKKTIVNPIKQLAQAKVEEKDSVKTIVAPKKIVEIEESPKEPEATSVTSMESVPSAPAGTAQFYITWKELSPNQKYQYLKSIEIPNLCKILGAGFDSDTFTDLLRTLQDFYVPNKEPTTAAVLLEISKNDEFTILSMLFSKEEKKMVANILNTIKEWPNSNSGLLDKLGKAYELS